MLGTGTQSIYVPERYRNSNSFGRIFKTRYGNGYKLSHIAPIGTDIYFVSIPNLPAMSLEQFEKELWDKEKSM